MLEVCRLCLGNKNLLDIFDCEPRNIVRLIKCISLATGIEIHEDDKISKCICYTCVQITVMFYKYRQKALANDRILKEYTEEQLQSLPHLNEEDTLNNDLLNLLKTNPEISDCVQKYQKPFTDKHHFQRPATQLQDPPFKLNKSTEKIAVNKVPSDTAVKRTADESIRLRSNEVINKKLTFNQSSTASLLERIDEETVFSCGYCNRMFTSRRNLKLHQRVYRFCSVCNGVFRNDTALKRHQQEVCFKMMAVNMPHVLLNRIDENIQSSLNQKLQNPNPTIEDEIIEPKHEILDELITYLEQDSGNNSESDPFLELLLPKQIKREKNDITVKTEQDLEQSFMETLNQMNKELVLKEEYETDHDAAIGPLIADQATLVDCQYELKPKEFKHIKCIFNKYKQASRVDATTLTKPHIDICYSFKNRVTLQKLGPLLKYCRIPIDLRVGSTRLNCNGFSKKSSKRTSRILYCWKGEEVMTTRKLKLNKR